MCFLILLAASSLPSGSAAEPDRLAKEKEKLQGTWQAVSIIDNGRAESADNVKQLNLTIKLDAYVYELGGQRIKAGYKVDPTKQPKEMDVRFEDGPQKGMTMLAIYSLEGDELRICGADKRPVELVSKPKSETILFVFKRKKP